MVEAIRGGSILNAVNAPGFDHALQPALRPYVELARRMGTILACITTGGVKKIEIIYRGAIAEMDVNPVTTHLLVGLLSAHLEPPVNVINAPLLARQRGVEVQQSTSPTVREFANLLEVRLHSDQMVRSVVGTIFGNQFPRLISIDGFRMEMNPEGHVVVILNEDRPGVLGAYGTVFGRNNINIADLTFSRKKRSGLAVVGVNLDSKPPDKVMDEIRKLDFVKAAYYMELPPLPQEEREQ
jgi:D-3-phosphoglycerate dehydrogenase